MKKIAIIGSGFGGLALGIRLQSKGFDVTIFEKNSKIGGHAYPLERKGYHFDMGPSLITAPDIIQSLFQVAGHNLFDEVDMIKLNPFYRIYFHDKSYLDYTDDSERMKKQIATFNQKDAENYTRFIKASKKIHDVVIQEREGTKPFLTLWSMLRFAPRAIGMNAVVSTYRFACHYFRDPRLRFTFSFHPLFIGGNPFRTPAIYEMIPYLEKSGGVWYSKGGMYSLIQTMGNIFKDRGGSIRLNTEVSEIIIKGKKATGIRTTSDTVETDAVVSNADFIHTYRDLITPEHRRKWSRRKLERIHYSMSAFLLYLGVRHKYPQLLHHTLILSHRYKPLIKDIFDHHVLPEDFSMYLHVPSRTDPTMAPPNCESLYVLVPVTNLRAKIDWEKTKHKYRDKILSFLENDFGLKNLKSSIEVCEMFTPVDFQKKQNATVGSAWGVEPRLTQTAYFRPHNRSEDIKNLYLVGASTHPGAGLPGCLLTAETTESLITKDLLSLGR
ncbi:phytoene desaturase [bacterium]|nr:phytoene desaturase [bacterium]